MKMTFKTFLRLANRLERNSFQNGLNLNSNTCNSTTLYSTIRSQSTFARKLQGSLDSRKEQGRFIEPPPPESIAQMTDFGSNDSLSLSGSHVLREAFLTEFDKNPDFILGNRSTRIFEGTTQYLTDLETDVAQFHKAESALFFPSGYEANVAIFSTLPQPGDIVVFDEFIHASVHDGMRRGRAVTQSFNHNDLESLRLCLMNLYHNFPGVAQGDRTVFICLESVYSMDADIPPIHDMIRAAKEILPEGNTIFYIDEAHSNGLVGPNGSGLVCHYGLENEFAIRLHTCGKGLGSAGGVVLSDTLVRSYLINYSRSVIFSTAPTFATLAAVKAGYNVLVSKEGEIRRTRLQENIRYFYQKVTSHSKWPDFVEKGVLFIPTENTWSADHFHPPIIPIVTRQGEAGSLASRLSDSKYWANAVHYPIVPKDKERVRVVVHADNTKNQIDDVVRIIIEWAEERSENTRE